MSSSLYNQGNFIHTTIAKIISLRMAWQLLLLASLIITGIQNTHAAYQSPVWEVGIAGGYLRTPEYRGAAKSNNYFIPFPYAAYRGHRLRIDEEGVRSKIFGGGNWKLDMRFAGNVPVKSKDSSKRAGMKSLDPVIEMGPSLEYQLWRSHGLQPASLWFRLPLRIMTSVSTSAVAYQGWSFAPYLEYVRRWRLTNILWNLGFALGPLLNGASYHNYFYQVGDADVTSSRTAYDSRLGYGGSRLTITLVGNSKHLWYGAFARYDTLKGAAFMDSPLVEKSQYTAIGVSIGWKFLRSKDHAR